MKYASAKTIIAAKRFSAEHPTGCINTGIWHNPTFTKEEFYAWFRKCLKEKTGGRRYADREMAKLIDARLVNDYQRGIRHSGCRNLLREPKNRVRYPHINNQAFSY